ncbi:serine-type carboxypeptidase [Metarhizium guizhouense ARSEF 977]|uniref:Carboxypeptidase n=1 Tax=Metarhizium guizhouense (strain ARSEF 977) TaxID=1276136 RepID=A0A0B4ID02_METGA|nr:serine-type carboxypeptidase [Metarhizium guizhouense ARSEF 977]
MKYHWLLPLVWLCISSAMPVRSNSKWLNDASSKYVVNGTAIPDIDFDIGESYAGLLPVTSARDETDNLYFWFFPTSTKEFRKKKEIVIWLGGGPGCSSLFGLSHENGPFLWKPGMKKPLKNPWAFNTLTNVVWVDQPVTTGFAKGKATAKNDDQVAKQFLGFWKNFVNVFDVRRYNIYIATESYGGMYGPYIAKHFIKSPVYIFKGLLIYDGIMFDRHIQTNVVVSSFTDMNRDNLPVDEETRQQWHNTAHDCNFTSYEKTYLKYPPFGPPPTQLPGYKEGAEGFVFPRPECVNLFTTVFDKITELNPCASMYNIMSKCPPQYDPIKGSDGPWFDREDVKAAINAPMDVAWVPCRDKVFANARDESPPSGGDVLPFVIDETQNVIIAHGAMDFYLPMNGVLLGIQGMTWGDKMGFQTAPKDPFIVPRYNDGPASSSYAHDLPSGTGIIGTTHHERGLTFVATKLAGHEGSGDSPAGALRHLEKLTGWVNTLSSHAPFTLPEIRIVSQPPGEVPNGVVPIPCFGSSC